MNPERRPCAVFDFSLLSSVGERCKTLRQFVVTHPFKCRDDGLAVAAAEDFCHGVRRMFELRLEITFIIIEFGHAGKGPP